MYQGNLCVECCVNAFPEREGSCWCLGSMEIDVIWWRPLLRVRHDRHISCSNFITVVPRSVRSLVNIQASSAGIVIVAICEVKVKKDEYFYIVHNCLEMPPERWRLMGKLTEQFKVKVAKSIHCLHLFLCCDRQGLLHWSPALLHEEWSTENEREQKNCVDCEWGTLVMNILPAVIQAVWSSARSIVAHLAAKQP